MPGGRSQDISQFQLKKTIGFSKTNQSTDSANPLFWEVLRFHPNQNILLRRGVFSHLRQGFDVFKVVVQNKFARASPKLVIGTRKPDQLLLRQYPLIKIDKMILEPGGSKTAPCLQTDQPPSTKKKQTKTQLLSFQIQRLYAPSSINVSTQRFVTSLVRV